MSMDHSSYKVHNVITLLAATLLLAQLACAAAAAPAVGDDSWTLAFNSTTTLYVMYNDENSGDNLTITAVSVPTLAVDGSKAVVVGCRGNDGRWKQQSCINYTAPPFLGKRFVQDKFNYTVQSDQGTATAAVTVDVTFAPVANDDTYEVDNITGSYTFAVLENDNDPNNLNITLDDTFRLPAGVTRTTGGQQLQVMLKGEPLSFTYQIRNDWYITDTATVTIKSSAPPPILKDDIQSVSVSRATVFQVLENDENGGNGLLIWAVTQPDQGTVSIANCSNTLKDYSRCIKYQAPDVPALVSFSYTAISPQGSVASARVTLQVALPPQAFSDTYKLATRKPTLFQVTANDKPDTFHALPFEMESVSSAVPGSFKVKKDSAGVILIPPLTGFKGRKVIFKYTITNWASDTSHSIAAVRIKFTAPDAHCDPLSSAPGCSGKPTRSCNSNKYYCDNTKYAKDGYYCQYAKTCQIG